jgi:CBS domain containing-hemolysin-like protein
VPVSTPLGDLLKLFVESEHTRLPVYGETLDEPMGVIHIKDVVPLLVPDDAGAPRADWSEPVVYRLKRDVLFVPPSMRCADLMLKMQASRVHLALVIDEFGGTDGLVTLEDLIESVVGEIEDEHDEAETPSLVTRPDGAVEVDGRTPLEELEAALGSELTLEELDEDIDTAAGLAGALAGRVPQRGEVVPHPGGFDFEVIDADPRRVKRLRVRRRDPNIVAPIPSSPAS